MKRFYLIVLAFCLMFSTGCGQTGGLSANYRAIEQLKLVHTLGFDLHNKGVELSISGGEPKGQQLTRLSAPGQDISDALWQIQQFSGKEELYYAHTRYVLAGEAYAKKGLGDILQYLESSTQLRSDLPLFIVRKGTAKDLILKAGGQETSPFHLLDAAVRDHKHRGDLYPFTCGDLASFSAEYGSALACALDIQPTNPIDPQSSEEERTPILSGYGVIKQGKLVGYLSKDAAKGVGLLIGQLGTGITSVVLNNTPVTFRIQNADTTLRPVFGPAGTMTELKVDMKLSVTLEESPLNDRPELQQLSTTFSKTVESWLEEILQTMRSTQCDFLGLGARIAISHPRQWHSNPVEWESQLKTLPMTAQVRCDISLGENEVRK